MDHWTRKTATKKKKPKTPFQIHLVLMTGVSNAQKALRDPLYSCCSAGTQMQPHADSWACGPWLGIFWRPPDWASAPSPSCSFLQEAHCVPNCMQGSRGQASSRMEPAKERLIAWTGCDQGSGFNDYTINVSACTPGPLWPGGNPTPQLLKRPDPSAWTLHS